MSEVQKMDAYYTIKELAERWKSSQSSVARYLKINGCQVLDLAIGKKKSKKIISAKEILRLEEKRCKVYR
jgi:response regulator of citrate/malate metabolism